MCKEREKELLVVILNGGMEAVLASQELVQIRTKEIEIKLEQVKEEKEKIEEVLKNGNNKILTLTDVVRRLDIKGLTTTLFNNWLVYKGNGEWIKFKGDKNKTFQPNERYCDLIAYEGYSLTSVSTDKKGKKKVIYTSEMINIINTTALRFDLEKFVIDVENKVIDLNKIPVTNFNKISVNHLRAVS